MHILSWYIIKNDIKVADFMTSFMDTFYFHVYAYFLCFTLIFWLLVKLHVVHISDETTRDDSLYEVLTHVFQVETIDYDGVTMRITSLLVTLFSFYIFVYSTNSTSTDLILLDEPSLIRS